MCGVILVVLCVCIYAVDLFLGMLLEKPAAEHHYVSYLRQLGDLEAVHKFYMQVSMLCTSLAQLCMPWCQLLAVCCRLCICLSWI